MTKLYEILLIESIYISDMAATPAPPAWGLEKWGK